MMKVGMELWSPLGNLSKIIVSVETIVKGPMILVSGLTFEFPIPLTYHYSILYVKSQVLHFHILFICLFVEKALESIILSDNEDVTRKLNAESTFGHGKFFAITLFNRNLGSTVSPILRHPMCWSQFFHVVCFFYKPCDFLKKPCISFVKQWFSFTDHAFFTSHAFWSPTLCDR